MNWQLYLIMGAIGLLITFLRAKSADDKAKEMNDIHDRQQRETRKQTEQFLAEKNIKADASFISADIALVLDRENNCLTILQIKNRNPIEKASYSMGDIASIRMIDRSEDWKHCQEMQRLWSGVERHSMYNPYGKHSTKEVKSGHERFESYQGEEVLGLEITLKSQPDTPIDIPCWGADGTMFWKQDSLYYGLKGFSAKAEEMRKSSSR